MCIRYCFQILERGAKAEDTGPEKAYRVLPGYMLYRFNAQCNLEKSVIHCTWFTGEENESQKKFVASYLLEQILTLVNIEILSFYWVPSLSALDQYFMQQCKTNYLFFTVEEIQVCEVRGFKSNLMDSKDIFFSFCFAPLAIFGITFKSIIVQPHATWMLLWSKCSRNSASPVAIFQA